MQGGAAEGARFRSAIDAVSCDKSPRKRSKDGSRRDDEVTPPLDTLAVVDEILISPTFDAWLERSREMFAFTLAMPVAWLHFDATVAACCSRKLERVMEGAEVVASLQKRYRTSTRDWYFSFWSFFADEEFYLIVLPIFFWNFDYRYARQMNYVVCFGLLWGNLLKDVFRLPRPGQVSKGVWVPDSASQIDSTACRDFGFPSTHSMNAVSNTFFTALYCIQHGFVGSAKGFTIMGVCMCVWIFSLTFGRLYLGVHSPMDVKGGLNLGVAIALIAYAFVGQLDRLVLTLPHVGILMLVFFALLLIFHPQARPMTPTFMQNALTCGLITGCAVGHRMETDRRAGRGFFGYGLAGAEPQSMGAGGVEIGVFAAVMRTILGYVLVMLVRALLKPTLSAIFRLFGLDPSPAKPVRREDAQNPGKTQELRGWDLCAAAFSKSLTYMALAWSITCGVPAIFDQVLQMPCAMNG